MFNISSVRRLVSCHYVLLVIGIFLSPLAPAEEEQREFTIGTWDNPPIVFRDSEGEITGLCIDILKDIARQNNWKLNFRHGSWAEVYDGLQDGTVDLLVSIAYTPERSEFLDYPKQTLINNWGVIYQMPEHEFTSVQDLQGQRIAMVSKVIHSKVFTELMDRFNFPFKTVEAQDFEDVLKLVSEGKADAGVINRVISIMKADQYDVKPTTIIFNPVQVRVATQKGKYPELIKAFDDYLIAGKANNNSAYYQAVNKWLKTENQQPDYRWLILLISVIAIIFAMILVYTYLVRREVKRRTLDLTESENRFRQMADNINAVFWIVSADWNKVIYVSPGYEKIWGLPTSNLYADARSWIDSVHPDDRAQVLQDIIARTPPGKDNPAFREYRIVRPDGQECWISTEAYPVFDNDGNVYRIAGISDDITARKLAELGLERSKAEFEAIFDSITDAVVYGDLDRRIAMVNPGMQETFGYSNDELIGNRTDMLYANKEDFEQTGRRQFNKSSDIKSATYEVHYRRKDGSTFIGETLGAKVFDHLGNTIGFIGVIRDVTQRKLVEIELLQYRDHLEELVSDRTTELSNLNQELEAFSYSVSHDLRAPLRAINGFSTLLNEEYHDQLDEAARDYLSRIIKASVKMERLIDDLLQISRVSRVDLHKENVDLSAMAEDILKTLQNEEPERKVRWGIEKGLFVRGDKTLIHVMMQNLLGNAWKYTAKTPDPEIKFHHSVLNGKPAAFCIEDNGCGFDMQFREKIFQPFQRLHTDQEFEGTGIGLATVNRVVHRHAGKIWAESTPNLGSRFYFHL